MGESGVSARIVCVTLEGGSIPMLDVVDRVWIFGGGRKGRGLSCRSG